MPAPSVGVTWISSKIAPDCFNISYGYGSISIRDQIVRAQLLISDLENICNNPSVLNRSHKIMIVGAGFAGATAAIVAAKNGFDVCLVDVQDAMLSLQRSVRHRYVGSFMYDWPSAECYTQYYPPDKFFGDIDLGAIISPKWEASRPISAADLAEKYCKWFNDFSVGLKIKTIYSASVSSVEEYVREFIGSAGRYYKKPKIIKSTKKHTFKADFLILACGAGEENTDVKCLGGVIIRGEKFWDSKDDGFRNNEKLNGNSLVFGGGDGALQDVLRLITRHDDALSIIESMEVDPVLRDTLNKVKPLLLSIQMQNILGESHLLVDIHKKTDERVKELAEFAVNLNMSYFIEWGSRNIRKISNDEGLVVHHILKENFFGKSFILNKFILHVINLFINKMDIKKFIQYKMHKEIKTEEDVDVYPRAGSVGILSTKDVEFVSINKSREFIVDIEFISVRFGIKNHKKSGINPAINDEYEKNAEFNPINSLGRIHLPRVVYKL